MKFLWIAALLVGLNSHAVTPEEIVDHIARKVIVQDYVDLASRAADLHASILTLKSSPTQENMLKAQQAWRDCRQPWETSEAFLYGPVSSLGLDPSIDTWPLNKIDLQAVLASNRTLDLDFVRNLGANLQGFHTVEYLLFGEGTSAQKKVASELTSKELEYLDSTSALLVEKTGQLAHAWTTNADPDNPSLPGFVEIISRPGPNTPFYPPTQAVLSEYVKGIIGILDEVANGKIAGPMGSTIGSADPSLVESPFSWNSVADFSNNVRSALYVYSGDYRATPGPGIIDVVRDTDPELAKNTERALRRIIFEMSRIGGDVEIPFREAIVQPEPRKKIEHIIQLLNELSATFTNKILPIVEG